MVCFFIYSAVRGEPLPDLLLRFQKKPYHALREGEKEKARERRLADKRRRAQTKRDRRPDPGD